MSLSRLETYIYLPANHHRDTRYRSSLSLYHSGTRQDQNEHSLINLLKYQQTRISFCQNRLFALQHQRTQQ